MTVDELSKYILSPAIIELFEVTEIKDDNKRNRMDIYLDERKVMPSELNAVEAISYGFTTATTVRDFPIRGKSVFLHLRRRKWLNKENNEIITRKISLTYKGTDLTTDFVAFLKATN